MPASIPPQDEIRMKPLTPRPSPPVLSFISSKRAILSGDDADAQAARWSKRRATDEKAGTLRRALSQQLGLAWGPAGPAPDTHPA